MAGACPDCGAPGGASCRDHFHALLLLESEIPGGPGNTTHFYAVGSYALQHPESMGTPPRRSRACGRGWPSGWPAV